MFKPPGNVISASNIEWTNIYTFKPPDNEIPCQQHRTNQYLHIQISRQRDLLPMTSDERIFACYIQISRQHNLLPATLNGPIFAYSNFLATQFLASKLNKLIFAHSNLSAMQFLAGDIK